jgi:CTP:phosphocholine cytidylyltransferase-like protein
VSTVYGNITEELPVSRSAPNLLWDDRSRKSVRNFDVLLHTNVNNHVHEIAAIKKHKRLS